ncbi:MAG: serine/threonine-protein kinase [Gemmatimonadota bacterium]|jgi:serine/threonine-protein kinase
MAGTGDSGGTRGRAEEIFEAALDLPREERADFVARACASDPHLAKGVMALLRAHERSGGVLERGSPGGAGSDAQGDEPGRYGPYRIIRRLGTGGMGEVYLAVREDAFMRRVALKVVRGGPWSDTAVRRFETERQIMASLNHPNIAQLLDGGVARDGVPFLAMEYVEGLPLTQHCEREGLTLGERLELFRKICGAVHHAHANLVIHRDLKPSNIIVTAEGEPKLLDFGIAKLLQPPPTRVLPPVTRPELRVLTPEYASPEQLRGEPLTTASDIFSLGILLYELLVGSRPFDTEGTTPAELTEAVCQQDPPLPSQVAAARRHAGPERADGARDKGGAALAGRLRGDLDAIVMMALRKEPGRRYASAEQLSEDVGRYLAGEPVLAYGESRAYRLRKFLRRHRLETAAAVAVIVSLMSGLAAATWQAGRARAERDRATRALERAEASADFLVGLFQTEDPRQIMADTLSARTMLERGLARVDALDAYPELRARLRTVVGRAYRSLGAYDRAEEVLRAAARDLQLAQGGALTTDGAREKATTLAELAEISTVKGHYDEGLSLAREARDVRVRSLGATDPDVATSLLQMSSIMVYLGDLATADSLARAAVVVRRRSLGDDDPKVTNAIETVASVGLRRGDVDEAEALLREVVARRRRIEGAGSPEYATALVRLANLLTEERDAHAEAEALFRRALSILDESAPERPTTMAGLAEVLAAQGRWDETRALYDRAITLRSSLVGQTDVGVADLLHGEGVILLAAGDLAGAEEAERAALAIWEEGLGPEHPAVAYALTGLSRVAAARENWDRAEALARQALAVRRDGLPETNTLVGLSQVSLAEILAAEGALERADTLLNAALVTLRATLPEGHREVRAVHQRLATVYEREGRMEEAARHRALADGPPRP